MVIEPKKGEYKNRFGGYDNVVCMELIIKRCHF